MKLSKLVQFKLEHSPGKANPLEIKDVTLGDLNLIVGQNGSGKTRVLNVIYNFSQVITKGARPNDNVSWDLEFINDQGKNVHYYLECKGSTIVSETMKIEGLDVLVRTKTKSQIYSETQKSLVDFSPPEDTLAAQVRRDEKEHPFLVELYNWGSETHVYRVNSLVPENVNIAPSASYNNKVLGGFEHASNMYEDLSAASKKRLLDDFNVLGFNIKEAKNVRDKKLPFGVKLIHFVESGFKDPLPQYEISAGMLRAFFELIVVQWAVDHDATQKTILIDDFTEGLDYRRADIFNEIVQNKIKGKRIQLVLTSNSRVLMNGINIQHWNILERRGSTISSYNYENSKAKFDEFRSTGLNNFTLFSSDFLKNDG